MGFWCNGSTLLFKRSRYEFESCKARMNETERRIVDLRKEGLTYRGIQIKLGNPSKRFIKETLKKYAPELAGDIVENYGRLR